MRCELFYLRAERRDPVGRKGLLARYPCALSFNRGMVCAARPARGRPRRATARRRAATMRGAAPSADQVANAPQVRQEETHRGQTDIEQGNDVLRKAGNDRTFAQQRWETEAQHLQLSQ